MTEPKNHTLTDNQDEHSHTERNLTAGGDQETG